MAVKVVIQLQRQLAAHLQSVIAAVVVVVDPIL
jgi:hypothetical protein